MSNVIGIGLPAMLEQICLRIGIIIYSRIVASLGDVAYATHQICMNIQSMTFMTGMAFANSATTLMGQSLGKRRLDMADNYTRMTRSMSFALSCVIGVGLALFGGKIVGIYNSTPEIIEIGGRLLLTVAFVQPFQSSQFVTAGALRGAGDTKSPLIITLASMWGVRVLGATVLIRVMGLGIHYVIIAMDTDNIVRMLLFWRKYAKGEWKTKEI